jgi:hypothetical protein
VPGTLATLLVAGDLNGDGLDDLVVMAAGSSQVFVYLQTPAGGFGPAPAYRINVGPNPSDLALLDVDGDHRPDIVVSSQFSGTVSVLLNDPRSPFSSVLEFRGGKGLASLDPVNGRLTIHSREAPLGLAIGDFNGDGTGDLVVTHSGANNFSVLPGSSFGGFLNPASAQNFTTGSRPTVVVTGRFNADPFLDLAILNEGSGDLSIFLGDGHGGFTEMVAHDVRGRPLRLSAGNNPTGLAVHDVNGDGKLDLLVGNRFGDVLALLGNGDGSFQSYQRTDGHIALAVADLNGDGTDDFVFGNEALDRVSVTFGQAGQRIVGDRHDGLLAPGAVRTADLNGDDILDLVVANSGANTVLVYLGTGNGQFGPAQSFFAGTNPVGLTIASLEDDLVPDPANPARLIDPTPDLVVANEGSNDVTVLLGQGQGTHWTLTNGPRLRLFDPGSRQSGIGPVATSVHDVNGDGMPDLLISSPQSNNVFQVNGLGRGLFDDQAPIVFATGAGSAPVQALVGEFDGRPGLDLVAIDSGSNRLTLFSAFGPGITLDSGGERPVAALAGDFNHDGFSDLIIANNDDGRVALLLGTEYGPLLDRIFSTEGLDHPTDLALGEDGTEVYVSAEGEEAVARFTLDFGTAVPVPVAPGLLGAGEPVQRLADVLPLSESSLATVAIFLTVSRTEATPADDTGENDIVFVVPRSTTVLPTTARGDDASQAGGTEDEPPDEDAPVSTPTTEAATDGLRIGVDDALQRSGAGLRERLLDEDRPPAPSVVPDEVLDEVFRRWLPGLGTEPEAGGQPLLQGSADLPVPADSLTKPLAEVATSLTALPESGQARGRIQPILPAAPAPGQPARSGHRQRPEIGGEAPLVENGSKISTLFLAAGFVSGLWLYRQTQPVRQHRPAWHRKRATGPGA